MAVYEPRISAVTISSNPVNINTSFTISVSVADVEVIMYTVSKISGAAISGQSITLATNNMEVTA